jgi:hypothetical protein
MHLLIPWMENNVMHVKIHLVGVMNTTVFMSLWTLFRSNPNQEPFFVGFW